MQYREGCCSWWHIPPGDIHFDSRQRNRTLSFCVVREPYHRFLSEVKWLYHLLKHKGSQCVDIELDLSYANLFHEIERLGDTYRDCHFIPQSRYIWDRTGRPTCQYLLDFEHLNQELSFLLREFSLTTRKQVNLGHKKRFTIDHCLEKILQRLNTAAVRSRVLHFYSLDVKIYRFVQNREGSAMQLQDLKVPPFRQLHSLSKI